MYYFFHLDLTKLLMKVLFEGGFKMSSFLSHCPQTSDGLLEDPAGYWWCWWPWWAGWWGGGPQTWHGRAPRTPFGRRTPGQWRWPGGRGWGASALTLLPAPQGCSPPEKLGMFIDILTYHDILNKMFLKNVYVFLVLSVHFSCAVSVLVYCASIRRRFLFLEAINTRKCEEKKFKFEIVYTSIFCYFVSFSFHINLLAFLAWPVWVGDLGTRQKNSKFLWLRLENRWFVRFSAVADIA